MKRPLFFLAAAVAAILIAGTAVQADVPPSMNVQGQLTDNAGNPVAAGIKVFTFKIFDQQVGGVEIWPAGPGEIQPLATDAKGLWNAGLGDVIPLTEAVFQAPVRWLEVNVNDGVNPPETLPRIELRTTPYTYRAATSQQADSLGGVPAGGFVLKAGDIMTGPLEAPEFKAGNVGLDGEVNVWANGPTAPVVSAAAHSYGGGQVRVMDESANRIGFIEPDADGDGGFFAVMGSAPENGAQAFIVDGNFTGAGNPKVTIAGLGAVSSFSTEAPGPGSVQLPDNSIEAEEIWDEPGLASSPMPVSVITFSTFDTLIATITAQFPREGFALIIGEATFQATSTNTWIDGKMYRNGFKFADWYWDAGDVDNWYDQRQTIVLTDTIEAAGFHTYDLRVRQNSGTASVTYPKLTVLFIPTAYGSVAKPVVSVGADDMSGVDLVRQHVVEGEPIDREASIQSSIAANQARIDREMAQMRAEMEALKAELRNSNRAASKDGSDR